MDLQLNNITHAYGDMAVLDDINFSVDHDNISSNSYANLHVDFGEDSNVDYYITSWGVWSTGVIYYHRDRYTERRQKLKYEIHIVRQSKRKYKMIGTFFHEIAHYVTATVFRDNEKMHTWIDRNNG